MKPDKPIVYNEFYLDAMTGGSPELPAPVTPEQHYLAHLAGMTVALPQPIILRDMFLAKICGMDVDIPTYIPGKYPRKFAYYAKAAGQDVEVPQPITREEMYWFDYVGGQPTPSEQEYTGAVPVTFIADGTPLLDFLISGNMSQAGTPTPDNPIMPNGTGERTGNLAKYWKPAYVTAGGSVNPNRVNGTSFPVKLEAGQTVSFTNQKANFGRGIAIFSDFDGETLTNMLYRSTNNTVIYTADSACYVIIWGNYDNTTSMDETVFNLCGQMLNLGSEALPYEPYGYKIPISSANTTTPVYLGEVQTTRKIKKLVLTGEEETWDTISGNAPYRIQLPDIVQTSDRNIVLFTSSHYRAVSNNAFWDRYTTCVSWAFSGGVNAKCLVFRDRNQATLADFKSYLAAQYAAGTPVTIWHVLAEPTTGIVNEPLMRIGDYADTLSHAQAGVSIPTANGSTTLDVETTVKPSEIYIKYHGEAVATLSTLSAEVSNPEETPEEVNPEETEEEENGSEDVSLQHEFEAIE